MTDPTAPRPVRLDPDSLDDCAALSNALYDQTGVDIDLDAIARRAAHRADGLRR